MKVLLAWIWAGILLVAASPAAAQWTEIRSDNFVYRGQSQHGQAETIIQDLESFRTAVMLSLGAEANDALNATRVFAVEPTPERESLLPFPGFTVLVQDDLDGPVFLINGAAEWKAGSPARHTLLKDYAQQLITLHASDQYPHWMQSGLADYYAGSGIVEGAFVLGSSIEKYDFALSRLKWVPMKTVLGAMRGFDTAKSEDDDLDTELFQQAQAWAAVRNILHRPILAARIPEYLNRLDAGEAADKAFNRGFGLSAKKFEKQLRKNVSAIRALPPQDEVEVLEPSWVTQVNTLNPASTHLAYGDVLRIFFFSDEGLAAADTQYATLTKINPEYGLALAGRAEVAAARGDFSVAEKFMTQAAAQASDDPVIRKRAGGLYLSQFDETGDAQWLAPARDHFALALENRGDDPAANFYYAAICAQIDCPKGEALIAAEKALGYYRDAKYIRINRNLLRIFDAEGKTQLLADFEKFAQVWSPKN